jgi:hypothetical protein
MGFIHLQIEWNPRLGGYHPQIPVLSALYPQLNLLNPPPPKKVCHWSQEVLIGDSTKPHMVRDSVKHHEMLSTNREVGGCTWLAGEKCVTHNVAIDCVWYHSGHSLLRLLFYRSRVLLSFFTIYPTLFTLISQRNVLASFSGCLNWYRCLLKWFAMNLVTVKLEAVSSFNMSEWMRLATCIKTQTTANVLNI